MIIRNQNGEIVDVQKMEMPEQCLAHKFIGGNDVVLELGARYGSVSCVINFKLNCKTNQVVVEPDERVWYALEFNRNQNGCGFHIVKGFVSQKKLGLRNLDAWFGGYGATSVEDAGTKIPSYTLKEVTEKYGLKFNVLVADCEGFLETFLDENPDFLTGLRLVMFEADCPEKCNYDKIRGELKAKGLVEKIRGHQNVWIRGG